MSGATPGWRVRLYRTVRLACRALCAAGLGLLLALAAMTTLDGVLRYAVGRPLDIVRDLGGPVSAVAVACCLPVAMIERAHVRLEVAALFSARLGRVCGLLADIVVLVLLAATAAMLWRYAHNSALNGDTSWMLRVPLAPFWYGCAIILWFATLAHAIAALSPAPAGDEAPAV